MLRMLDLLEREMVAFKAGHTHTHMTRIESVPLNIGNCCRKLAVSIPLLRRRATDHSKGKRAKRRIRKHAQRVIGPITWRISPKPPGGQKAFVELCPNPLPFASCSSAADAILGIF